MVETHVRPGSTNGAAPFEGVAELSDRRKQEFAKLVAAKVAQGYTIESQSDLEAVVVSAGRRRMFRPSIAGKRQRLCLDEKGRLSTRGL